MQTRRLELFTTIHTEGAILPVDLLQHILVSLALTPALSQGEREREREIEAALSCSEFTNAVHRCGVG